MAWDGSAYGVLYHLLYDGQCFCTPVSDELPWMLRVSSSGAATRSAARRWHVRGFGLSAGKIVQAPAPKRRAARK